MGRDGTTRRARSLTARIAAVCLIVLAAFLAIITSLIDAIERAGAPALISIFVGITLLSLLLGRAVALSHSRSIGELVRSGAPVDAYPKDGRDIAWAVGRITGKMSVPDRSSAEEDDDPFPADGSPVIEDSAWPAMLRQGLNAAGEDPYSSEGPVTAPVPAIRLDTAPVPGDAPSAPTPNGSTPDAASASVTGPAAGAESGRSLDEIIAELRRIAQGGTR